MKKHKKYQRLIELEDKIKELENGWKRAQADFENYRKRSEKERGEILELMKADFIAKITPVLDNFRRAFEHTSHQVKDSPFGSGIKQIEKQLGDILTSEGLHKIPANTGTKFDPSIHEAISHEPNEDIPADHIIEETESGWMFEDKVIKPTKVRVSKGK